MKIQSLLEVRNNIQVLQIQTMDVQRDENECETEHDALNDKQEETVPNKKTKCSSSSWYFRTPTIETNIC